MDCTDLSTPTSLSCLPFFLGNIIDKAVILAGVAAVFFITIAGVKFITSGGDPGQVNQAKKTISFAVIGLLVVLLSFTIIKFISRVVNISPSTIGIQGDKK